MRRELLLHGVGHQNCVNCMFPHRKENYDRVIARFGDIVRKMQESEKEHE